MTKQTVIRYNLKGLENLQKQVGDQYRARVGILGSKAARTEPGAVLNNAQLGIIQMFGSLTKKIPPRDFLFMPVQTHSKEIVQALGKSTVQKAIADGDYKKVYSLLGAAALQWVLAAFETAGFGQWLPNAPSTIRQKKSDRPLINYGELRRAQSFDVVSKGQML